MSRVLARPALVPTAIAVGLPLSLARVSLLAAGLSLVVSAVLVLLAMQITRESRSNAARKVHATKLLGLGSSTLVGSSDRGRVQW
jgi:hypothetical protein